jgi:hypothetical protein
VASKLLEVQAEFDNESENFRKRGGIKFCRSTGGFPGVIEAEPDLQMRWLICLIRYFHLSSSAKKRRSGDAVFSLG